MVRQFLLIAVFFLLLEGTSLAKWEFSFEGQLDLNKKALDITLNLDHDNALKATAQQVSPTDYQFIFNAEHFKMLPLLVAPRLESSLNIASDPEHLEKSISGKIWSQDAPSLNHPVKPLKGEFAVRDQKIYLNNFSLGEKVYCDGNIELVYPYKVDILVKLNSVDMDEFLDFWMDQRDFPSEGSVSGEIKVGGALDQLQLKGSLESYNGLISELKYNSLYLHAEGTYPELMIAKSVVSEKEGMSFSFEGPFALNDKANFKKQIKALTITPLVNNKENSSEWIIKRVAEAGEPSSELKYFLRKDENIDSHLKEDTNMVGVKKTLEF